MNWTLNHSPLSSIDIDKKNVRYVDNPHPQTEVKHSFMS